MILLLDANNLSYRADQTNHLTTKSGERVGAIYGTLRMIQSYIKPSTVGYNNLIMDALKKELGIEGKFDRVVAAWDGGKSKWRKSFYPAYKAQREENRAKKTEEEQEARAAFLEQMNTLHRILPNFGVKSLKVKDWEADDLIYTVTKVSKEFIVIVSTDQDMLQLVSDRVVVWSPFKEILYTKDNFQEKTGVAKESYLDYRKLVGDSSDNIPGIQGIGEKTGKKLMAEFGCIAAMIPHIERLSKSKVTRRIFENAGIIDRNDALMNMQRIPMEVIEPYVVKELQKEEKFDEIKSRTFLMSKQFVSILKVFLQWKQLFKQLR